MDINMVNRENISFYCLLIEQKPLRAVADPGGAIGAIAPPIAKS